MRRLWLGILIVTACGDGKPKSASGTIDPATGGTVALSDNSAGVTIPPGALMAPTVITVSTDSTSPPSSLGTAVSATYDFGPEGTQFSTPVTVTLAVNTSKLTGGRTLADVFIATAPAGSTDFSALPTTTADSTHVAAQTSHFSLFVAIVKPVEDAAVPNDGGAHDAAVAQSDMPMTLQQDMLMASNIDMQFASNVDMEPSPAPSCSPYPTPSPSCAMSPAPYPSISCGLQMIGVPTVPPYQVYCDLAGTCHCQKDALTTDTFPQANFCNQTDGGTSSGLWQRCCYPGLPN